MFMGMRHLALPIVLCLSTVPALAQDSDGPSLMERGAQLFFEGLMKEMEPAIDDLSGLAEEFAPALRDFATQMGPKFRELMEEVEDWSAYEAPEVLPNGDIIIRRKPERPIKTPEDGSSIEL